MNTSTTDPRAFNTRAFVGAMALLSGISLPVSGIANHLTGFDNLTLQRHAWMAAHNMMGLLFLVFVTWHAILNRHMLARHLRAAKLPKLSREAAWAATIVGGLMLLAVGHAFAAAALKH